MRVFKLSLFVPAIFAFVLCAHSAAAQNIGPYPPYTTVMQQTQYDAAGVVTTSVSTAYHSSNGDWRIVRFVDGYEVATLYRRGRGVYVANGRTGVMVKETKHAPGCPLRTAAQLRSDPSFARTESVHGFTAYVWSRKLAANYLAETFFVPELGGGTPLKQIYTFAGQKIINEPVSVTLGEPSIIDVKGPDYRVIDQEPVFNNTLEALMVTKPVPVYPIAAQKRGISGDVYVRVIIDGAGKILHADSNSAVPFLTEAAVDAAYQATFSPTLCDGKPVVSTGLIVYYFPPPVAQRQQK